MATNHQLEGDVGHTCYHLQLINTNNPLISVLVQHPAKEKSRLSYNRSRFMFSCSFLLSTRRSEMCVFIQPFVQNKQNKKTVVHKQELKVLFTPLPNVCLPLGHAWLPFQVTERQTKAGSSLSSASRHHPLRRPHRQPDDGVPPFDTFTKNITLIFTQR